MRQTHQANLLAVLAVLGLATCAASSSFAAGPSGVSSTSLEAAGHAFPTASWALGVVVPNGAMLQGGGHLSWTGVANLTASMTLPNITLPDGVVYAVMSVMASDGSVMQSAAGVFPNRSVWLAYAWSIASPNHPTYQWILNGSAPQMSPGTNLSMSIYMGKGTWDLKITDRSTGASVSRQYPSDIPASLKTGDQEVFALESYSRSAATFQHMGNLTLQSVSVNGERVTAGVYSYGDWDPRHNPVFVVGSSGTTPPTFISLEQVGPGSYVWGFGGLWGPAGGDYGNSVSASLLLLVLGVTAVALLVGFKVIGKATRSPLNF